MRPRTIPRCTECRQPILPGRRGGQTLARDTSGNDWHADCYYRVQKRTQDALPHPAASISDLYAD